MAPPFTPEQFFAVFAAYSRALGAWPLAAYALGAAAVWGAWRGGSGGARLAWGAAAVLWAWTGGLYHGLYFARINPAAYGFAAVFAAQAGLLGWEAWRGRCGFRTGGACGWAGTALVAYAMVLYPLLGARLGHAYPRAPLFGVTPCPTTLFTAGLLLWAEAPPRRLAAIPLAWALVGTTAAWLLGVWEDLGLVAAAAAGAWVLGRPRRGRGA